MLRVLRRGGGGLRPVEAAPGWVLPKDVAWVDLTNPDRAEELLAEGALGIQLPTREEMAEIEPSSRLYQENGAAFMTAFVLVGADGDDPALQPVTFVLAEGRLVTIRYVEPRAFIAYAAQAERDADFCQGGVDAFLGLLDAVVDRIADILEKTRPRSRASPATSFARRGSADSNRSCGGSAAASRSPPRPAAAWSAWRGCCPSPPWPMTSPTERSIASGCGPCSGTCSR